jgi:hypothetical protein
VRKRNAIRILVGKPERKRPLGGPRHRWENNIVSKLVLMKFVARVWSMLNWLRIGSSGGHLNSQVP